ncbi:cytochrome P450 family protein [Rhodococcus koreensis]|uniref:hypothetical protein n=1 Tax=Rhodococcus koreensis TaxID=99653 RepID=UPI0036DCD981
MAIYAGCMAGVAQTLVATWAGSGQVDLDRETRRLTLRVPGQSLFGIDLDAQAEALGPALDRAARFVSHRALQSVRAPEPASPESDRTRSHAPASGAVSTRLHEHPWVAHPRAGPVHVSAGVRGTRR